MTTCSAFGKCLAGTLIISSLLLAGCEKPRQQAATTPPAEVSEAAPVVAPQDFNAAMQAEGAQTDKQPMDITAPMGSSKAVVPLAGLKIDKATGDNSFTVAELFAKAAELNGKTVRVRGQLVKVSPNIMGRNWLHLQDGSGAPTDNTHDLVATTDQTGQAGDTVTIEGKLSANKDFGAGYVYAVIVEEAKIEAAK